MAKSGPTTIMMLSSNLTRTLTGTAASSTATAVPSTPESSGECKLLGQFAILVQAALGALALSTLVFKRWRERPQRPWKIWAFDVSKQVLGSVLLHILNVFMSMLSSGEIGAAMSNMRPATAAATANDDYQPNPCSFYLLNLAIDTTLGIPVLILILRVLTVGASHTPLARPPESIQSGNYGDPPQTKWWLKQSLIYFVGLLGMKTCVFIFFQLCPWIAQVGDWALRWTEGNEALQIAFVMFLFPLIMNAAQYYIIDGFIKNSKPAENQKDAEGGRDRNEEEDGLLAQERAENVLEEDEPKSNDKAAKKDIAQVDGESSSTARNLQEDVATKRPIE